VTQLSKQDLTGNAKIAFLQKERKKKRKKERKKESEMEKKL